MDFEVDALEHVVTAEVLLQALDLDDQLATDDVLRRNRGGCRVKITHAAFLPFSFSLALSRAMRFSSFACQKLKKMVSAQ